MSHCNPFENAAAGSALPPFVYLSARPALPGASRLVSLPYLGFAAIRAYRNREGFACFVLADVFRALGKGNTSTMRKRVKDPADISLVRVWVTNSANPQDSGFRMVQALDEGGMHAMLGVSKQESQIALRRWVTATAVPILRTV